MAQDSQENGSAKNDSSEYHTGQTLGSYLQRERFKKQFSLEEVASQTCISIGTLRAIEDNDRDKMPAEVFTRGFIKLYAKFLDLEPQDVLDRYNQELGHPDEENIRNHEVFQNEKMAESSAFFNLRILFFLLIVLVIVALGVYFFLYSEPSTHRSSSSFSSGANTNSLSSQINQKFQSVETPAQTPYFSPSQVTTYSSPTSPTENRSQGENSSDGTPGTTELNPNTDQPKPQLASPVTGAPATESSPPPVTPDKQEVPSPFR